MKLSNFYTSLRILLAPVFYIFFFFPGWTGYGAELSVFLLIPLFVFMEFTDYLDGYYARKLKQVSDFGKLYDPFADVVANMTVLVCFVLAGYLPAVLFLIILYREMGIMFIRMLARGNGISMGARKGGKAKTVLYIVAAGYSLCLESIVRLNFSLGSFEPGARIFNLALYVLAVLVSVASFIDYIVYYLKVTKNTTIDR